MDVPTARGERHQLVHLEHQREHCELWSVVLGSAEVTSSDSRWSELARRAWLRNAASNLVTFTFDDEDRLIGHVRHLAAHLDVEELELYITVLAAECDRFEYVLTGADES